MTMPKKVEVPSTDLVERLARVYRLFWEAGVRDGLVGAAAPAESDVVPEESAA
jgi:hypothetical protein